MNLIFSNCEHLLFQDIEQDIIHRKPNYENFNESITIHLDICSKEPVDEPISEQKLVASELESFNRRWDQLNGDVKDYIDQAENVEKEVKNMSEKKQALDDLFDKVLRFLDEQKPVSTNPNKCHLNLDEVKVVNFCF